MFVFRYNNKKGTTGATVPAATTSDEKVAMPTEDAKQNDEQQDEGDQTHEEEEDSTRGMEVYCKSRQRYCKRYVLHVLEACRRYNGPAPTANTNDNEEGEEIDRVALLANKWSANCRRRAAGNGLDDFAAAYAVYYPGK